LLWQLGVARLNFGDHLARVVQVAAGALLPQFNVTHWDDSALGQETAAVRLPASLLQLQEVA